MNNAKLSFCVLLFWTSIGCVVSGVERTVSQKTGEFYEGQIVHYEKVELKMLVQILAKLAKKNFIIRDDVKSIITFDLENGMSFDQKIRTIVESSGYILYVTNGCYLAHSKTWIVPEELKAELASIRNETEVIQTDSGKSKTKTEYHQKNQFKSFENADLNKVLPIIVKEGGINLIIPSEIKGTITARLRNVPFLNIMKIILLINDYSVIESNGSYRVGLSNRVRGSD